MRKIKIFSKEIELRFFDRWLEGTGIGLFLLIYDHWFFRVAIGEPGDWLWADEEEGGQKNTYFFSIMKTENEKENTGGWAVYVGPLAIIKYGYNKRA